VYCGACAAPYVVTPLLRPLKGDRTPAGASSIATWYILKANAWIAVFSFIGNYWYTHYFYGVLKANYTFDAHRLNDVPISMYLMTHAYFMFYHALTNCALRFVKSKYEDDAARWVFTCALVAVMAYTTAFMESLTICGFPYYTFADRDKAYTLGSAFYGIYFLVSFPMFLRVDEDVVGGGKRGGGKGRTTHWTTFWEAMGSGMAVLCLLDFVRVHLGLDFCMYAKGH
jgi:cycloeucalenol cycloisomerase